MTDARNVLTGVIDSPETFVAIKSLFARVFVWVLLKHRLKKENNFSRIQTQESVVSKAGKQVDSTTTNPNLEAKSVLFYDVLKTQTQSTSEELTQFGANNVVLSKWSDDEEETDVLGSDNNSLRQSSQHSQNETQTKESVENKNQSNDEFKQKEELLEKVFESSPQINSSLISNSELNSGENFFHTFEDNGNKIHRNIGSSDDNINSVSAKKSDTSEELFNSLSPTDEWLTASLDYSYRKRINQSVNQFMFSDDWFKSIINKLCDNSPQLSDTQMSLLIENYKQIVSVCFSCILPLNPMSKTYEISPQTIHQIFDGKVPENGYNTIFFDKNQDLYEIVIQSFRYCLKIAIDLILMAEDMPTIDQLIDILIDYDNNWFIGNESSIEWKNSLIEEKGHLFSIGRDAIKVSLNLLYQLC